jgi:hypothetical protein
MGEGEKNKKDLDLDLDLNETTQVFTNDIVEPSKKRITKRSETIEMDAPISCLRDEVITVRHIPRESGMITNPKHIFYGGLAENATRTFTVPILETSNTFVNVLTTSEKNYLEEAMGLEPNALSIYLKQNNFWDNFSIRLTKGETYLKLSDPTDYIKYKVLLANKDFIAPNLTALNDSPKATYQFVLIAEKEEAKESNKNLTASMQAYMIFGKIKDEKKILKLVVETIDGRPISAKSDIEFIQSKAYDLIQANAKLFVQVAQDPYLNIKVLISEALEFNLIKKRGDYLYLASDNSPLSNNNDDPTISNAAKFLSLPKNQETKLMLEAKIKNLKSQE